MSAHLQQPYDPCHSRILCSRRSAIEKRGALTDPREMRTWSDQRMDRRRGGRAKDVRTPNVPLSSADRRKGRSLRMYASCRNRDIRIYKELYPVMLTYAIIWEAREGITAEAETGGSRGTRELKGCGGTTAVAA